MEPSDLTGEGIEAAAKKTSRAYIIAFALAFAIAGSAFAYKYYFLKPPVIPREIPKLGIPGSTHAHASFLLMLGKQAVNFCDPKYMLKSKSVHMEDGNCYVIHKHATGVTIPTFFHSIGVELSASCVETPADGKFCNDGTKTLRAVVNGREMPIGDLPYYELQNNDHILINYGPESGTELRFKYNQVPPIPIDVNEPAT